MNPEIIKTELLVIGIETTSREATVADDVHAQGELAGKLNLPATIPNQIDMGTHLVVLWDFQPENDFQAMTAVAVSAVEDLPSVCRAYRFPMSEYAVFPIAGQMPNLVEPWAEIHAWYPEDRDTNTTMIRKYNDAQRTGELWLPMDPHLKPVLEARGDDA
ncbi:MAG: GyrI-like domain-containing protein [Pseudomonadota bacterium]